MILLDTNVVSETLKPLPSDSVASWFEAQGATGLFTTAITIAEISYGLELMPKGRRRTALKEAVEKLLVKGFANRILPFEDSAARVYGQIGAERSGMGRPISQSDAMIAAIARTTGMILATRNIADFEGCEIALVNPWLGI